MESWPPSYSAHILLLSNKEFTPNFRAAEMVSVRCSVKTKSLQPMPEREH